MRSWQVYGVNDMRLEDIPIPEARPGWALARVRAFQPSITEVQRFWGTSQRGQDKMRQTIQEKGPYAMGHEVCADVVAVDERSGFRVGDRVAYSHAAPGMVSGDDYPGCFAEYVLLPIPSLFKVDASIPDVECPALQPLASCVHDVEEARIELHETVVVFGQGVMGLNMAQLCRRAGAERVIGVDVRDQCLAVSRELGVDVQVNAGQQDPVAAIRDLTNGRGADVAFDCASGSPEVGLSGGKTLFQAIEAVRIGGRLIQIAFHHQPVLFDPNQLRAKRIKYIFPGEGTGETMALTSRLVASGKVQLKPYITHVLSGVEKLPDAMEITGHKASHGAINPAVVIVA
ncbi:MAG: zinc-binding dehydrogenase [Chloroflexi bacterium]|nr:zinc-binding dehydrogenase [Chloroflexota bacterium]